MLFLKLKGTKTRIKPLFAAIQLVLNFEQKYGINIKFILPIVVFTIPLKSSKASETKKTPANKSLQGF